MTPPVSQLYYPPNKVSKQTFAYDKYTNQTDVYEYDFAAGGVNPLVRRSHTDYLTASYDTLNPSATNPDLNLTSHIRNLPTQVSTFDAGNVERTRSTIEYDNYVLDGADCLHSYHCALQTRSNISGFDSQLSTGYTMRGNPTRSTSYLLSNGAVTGSVSAYSHYDVAGNVIRAINPRSTSSNFIVTTIDYDDRFGIPDTEARANAVPGELTGFTSFAFPTKVTNPLAHTSYAQFDYYVGKPVNGEDANGVVASGQYSDLLDRPTQIRRGIGTGAENQTTFDYNDATRIITTSSDRDAYGDNLLVSKVKYDQMGRTTETRQYEGGDNYIVVETQYDVLGRAYKTSNPYRWQSESAVWTTQAFDALGRVISVTTPDNAVVNTSYSGNSVTVTDQAGKTRQSVTDALGRLTQVYEGPTGATFLTTYEYDVLDSLTRVIQDNDPLHPQQPPRVFVYDSLKRLTAATNPESGTTTYQYDSNSNLTFKTDARGVVTENRYDALNRVTTVLYRINGQPDPNTGDIEYLYDNATNGKGRLWLTYRWGAKPSHTAVGLYDALGRVTQLHNLFGDGQGGWSAGYTINRSYNRAGAVTSQTYPSGHTVTYNYDSAGRLADKDAQNLAFTGNLGDGVQRTYSRGLTYVSAGQLKQEQFGTATPVYNKLFYNSRLQLAEILTSTTANDSSWNRGKILNQYSLQCSGASCNATDNNGNLRKQEVYIPADDQVSGYTSWSQLYDYDALNRLQRVHEYTGNPQLDWQQEFQIDQWGNRTINGAQTWGTGVNNKSFDKNLPTNRLYAPGDIPLADSLRRIRYDAAGNQIKDTYTGYGAATFDAENRIVAVQDSYAGWSYYTYNADGQRVRRKIGNQETWQIYGIDGELLAEYPVNGAVASPQKEYGYRNGQLLITAVGGSAQIQWLVTDHLGTPRMIFDQTGSLANMKRHDYLPFGEELFAGAGGRTAALGYSPGDGVRQQFTEKERDVETGLDYFGARYYASMQGRFTSPDPLLASGRISRPQSWNRYTYVLNNPMRLVDPTGLRDDDPQKQQLRPLPFLPQQQPPSQPQPVTTQSASLPASEIPQCHMCFGQISTRVVVDQMNSPGARVRNVNGTDSLVVGVDLRFTFLDQNGDPLSGTVSESVQPQVTQTTGAVPLDGQGQGGDLVSNSFGSVPASASDQRNAIQFFNTEFTTNQTVTFSVVPDNGIATTVTQQRTLTNMVPGGPPIAGGAIKGYTFTMETPKIRVP